MSILSSMNTQLVEGYARFQRVRGFSLRTVERRRWSLKLWMQYLEANGRGLDEAAVDDLERFLDRWPSAQSRQSIRSDLRMFYGWAIERGHLTTDPTDLLPSPRVPARAASPIAREDVERLIAGTEGRARLAIMLAALAGLRVSEIGRLRGEDVDIAGRAVIVRGGKGGHEHVLPLAAELAAELEQWPSSGVLLGVSGTVVGDLIRRALRRHGIDGRPHDLRHSFGTELARRTNGNLVLTSRLMRHERMQTTVRYIRWHTTGHDVVTGLYGGDAA